MDWKETYREWLRRNSAPGVVDMTEDEWERCPLATVMLRFLYAFPNGRKRRLFAVACCRRIESSIPPNFLPFVDLAEAYAEGKVGKEDLWNAFVCVGWMREGDDDMLEEDETPPCEYDETQTEADSRFTYCVYRVLDMPDTYDYPTKWSLEDAAGWVAQGAADAASFLPEQRNWDEAKLWAERAIQADLLRDIYGNPFRSLAFDPAWNNDAVAMLARTMYETGVFDRMSQLKAALFAAGCRESAVLEHCDSDKPHVRGCWVVDVLLGKSQMPSPPLYSSQEKSQLMRTLINEDPYRHLDAAADWNKKGIWPCKWVSCPKVGEPPFVTAYRLRFSVEQTETVRVHVTADERYELFLDGKRIGRGSERGDGAHWFFETYDLSLNAGEHVLVARVWSLGGQAPFAQMTVRPGFLLSPQEEAHIALLGTGVAAWEAKTLTGYRFLDPIAAWGTGANVLIDGSRFDWGFEMGYGSQWQAVESGEAGSTARRNDRPVTHLLEPATLPPMREERWQRHAVRHVSVLPLASLSALFPHTGKPHNFTRSLAIRAADNLHEEAEQWTRLLAGGTGITIPPHTCRRVLIDLEDYVCAYPEVVTSYGMGSMIRVHWQESLFNEANTKTKGNRDEIEGKYFVTIWHGCDGIGDAFLPDGNTRRKFETLWWQCGRYVEIVVQTAEESLQINSLTFHETRYPLEMEARFDSSDARLADVTPLMLRGLQMCSHETYMDCPYYEQLMYVGDTRLEVLTTYTLTRDTRLPRKALRMFDISRQLDGLTQSRYPTRVFQSIPPFSLWWVMMVHDYARWRDDRDFVRSLMPGARGVVEHYLRLIDSDGLLHAADGWNCFDWVPTWQDGTPPGGHRQEHQGVGGRELGSAEKSENAEADSSAKQQATIDVSGPVTWQLVWALRLLAELETLVGEPELAARAKRLGGQLAMRANEAFWNEERGILADDVTHAHYSEHSQCLALLSGMVEPERETRITDGLLTAPDLARTTIYFSHYLFETFHLLRRTDKILERMGLWFDLKAQGLKTTVEMPEPTRSDCHAWGAHPLFHYFASILGIRPASMGFRSVRITPDLGPLEYASGTFPHPLGDIHVELHRAGENLHGWVTLPEGLKGAFSYNGTLLPLRSGRQEIGDNSGGAAS